MKAIAIHHPKAHHANFWDLITHIFKDQLFEGAEESSPSSPPTDPWSDLKFFQDEDELEDYVQAFRE